jgi:hypothetical protein
MHAAADALQHTLAQGSFARFAGWYCCLAPLGIATILGVVYALVRRHAERSQDPYR